MSQIARRSMKPALLQAYHGKPPAEAVEAFDTTLSVGGWTYDPKMLVLNYAKGCDEYEVDLEGCSTAADVLDWICQVASKNWASSEVVGDLVAILQRLLRPQATLIHGPGLPKGDDLRKIIDRNLAG